MTNQIRALITRLARIDAAQGWAADMNPAQRTALEYLARANRFSRSPSHLADFLGTTRGTTSQTLKALVRKGYVVNAPSQTDNRSISYQLTEIGRDAVSQQSLLGASLNDVPTQELTQIAETLHDVLGAATKRNGSRPFGVCRTCRHFQAQNAGGYCQLMQLALQPNETSQICHEQVPK